MFILFHGCDFIRISKLYRRMKRKVSPSVQFEDENDVTPAAINTYLPWRLSSPRENSMWEFMPLPCCDKCVSNVILPECYFSVTSRTINYKGEGARNIPHNDLD